MSLQEDRARVQATRHATEIFIEAGFSPLHTFSLQEHKNYDALLLALRNFAFDYVMERFNPDACALAERLFREMSGMVDNYEYECDMAGVHGLGVLEYAQRVISSVGVAS